MILSTVRKFTMVLFQDLYLSMTPVEVLFVISPT